MECDDAVSQKDEGKWMLLGICPSRRSARFGLLAHKLDCHSGPELAAVCVFFIVGLKPPSIRLPGKTCMVEICGRR